MGLALRIAGGFYGHEVRRRVEAIRFRLVDDTYEAVLRGFFVRCRAISFLHCQLRLDTHRC